MKLRNIALLSLVAASLTGCAGVKSDVGNFFGYSDENYISKGNADSYFRKHYAKSTTTVPTIEYAVEKIPVSRNAVMTSFGFSKNPEVKEAYEQYITGGQNFVVKSDGFITYPYDQYSRPILECSLGRVCSIQLESGEQMTSSPSLGDSSRWAMDVMTTGTGDVASQIITIKPILTEKAMKRGQEQGKLNKFSTNIMITTTKRVYNIGLLAVPDGAKSTTMNFYYPFETSEMINSKVEAIKHSNGVGTNYSSGGKNDGIPTDVDFNSINPEAYKIKVTGKKAPKWTPTVVFDDGHKTFIKLPANTDQYQLPAVWIQRDTGDKELSSNDTFQKPYFILDGVYKKVFLFSGADVDGNKQEVVIKKD